MIGEVEGAIVTYDKSEIEAVQEKQRKGELEGDERIWEVGGNEETPPEENLEDIEQNEERR